MDKDCSLRYKKTTRTIISILQIQTNCYHNIINPSILRFLKLVSNLQISDSIYNHFPLFLDGYVDPT